MDDYRFDPDPSLRVGDAEREQTADRLRRSHTEGRLDAEEFQERLERCYTAKTAGELRQLVADLPGEQRAPGPFSGRRSLRGWRLVPLFPILLTIFLVSALIHGHWFGLWLLLPLFFVSRFWFWRRRPWWTGWRRGSSDQRA